MSGAFALVAGWDLRRRGCRVLFLVVLVGVVGACVLATVAGARRSSTALSRFKASSRSADLELAAAPTAGQVARLRRLPGVAAVAVLPAYGLVIPSAPDFQSIGAATDPEFGRGVDRDRLIAGRRPDPGAVHEITIGEGLANRLQLPVEIDRLRQIDWLPVALTLLLGAFVLLAVGHGLVTGVRRRRRELALLKTLGFVRRQVRATIGWQATALAAIGIVVGVPLGVVVGSLVWRAVADGLGIDGARRSRCWRSRRRPWAPSCSRAVAWWPARAAGRVRPAVALRSE